MNKRVYILSLWFLLLLGCLNTDIIIAKDDLVVSLVEDARGYERSLEGLIDGTFSWNPISEGDVDAEYGDFYKMGKSVNSSNSFRYFYDYSKDFLVQYFCIGDVSGIMTWKGGVPIGYEVFN